MNEIEKLVKGRIENIEPLGEEFLKIQLWATNRELRQSVEQLRQAGYIVKRYFIKWQNATIIVRR